MKRATPTPSLDTESAVDSQPPVTTKVPRCIAAAVPDMARCESIVARIAPQEIYYAERAVRKVVWECSRAGPRPLARAVATAQQTCPDLPTGLPIYAVEINRKGKRRFGAMSHAQFLRILQRDTHNRYYYEVVCGPCKLFMDIDVTLPFETHVEKDARRLLGMVRSLVHLTIEQLNAHFALDLDPIHDVVVLCASKGTKMSYHIIFQTPGVRFRSMLDAGRFVEFIKLKTRVPFNFQPSGAPEAPAACILDTSVYNGKSRCFRVYGCTKHGPVRPLRPCLPWHKDMASLPQIDPDLFYRSLVTYIPQQTPVERLLTVEWMDAAQIRSLLPEGAKHLAIGIGSSQRFGAGGNRLLDGDKTAMPPALQLQLSELANLLMHEIESQIPECSGELTYLDYYADSQTLIFTSLGHYCEIKGDEHRHNHVFYVVYLTTKDFAQGCWNAACRKTILSKRFYIALNRLPTDAELNGAAAISNKAHATVRGQRHMLYEGLWPTIDAYLKFDTTTPATNAALRLLAGDTIVPITTS